MTYPIHEAAAVFPLIEGPEFEEFVADLRTNGLQKAIVLWNGQVLDGRNRLRGCEAAGIEPRYVDRTASIPSPAAYVVSANLRRRHMNESQRAMVAGRLLPMMEAEARERMLATLKQNKGPSEPQRAMLAAAANLPERDPAKGEAREHAATMVNVSPRAVQDAKTVLTKGAESLVRAVDSGKVAVSTAAVVADLPKAEQADLVARGEKEILRAAREIKERKQAEREEKKQALAEQLNAEPVPLPAVGPFRVLVIDPPWRYEARAEDTTHRARNPYPDMSLEEIRDLPVADLSHDDAILWLWTTNAFLRDAFALLDAWGFEERTVLTWVKDRMGTGDWLRGKTEHCILAIRGKPAHLLTNQTTVLEAPLREHSRKPDEFYSLVEATCPGTKVEMFARQAREGWASWGAEVGKFA